MRWLMYHLNPCLAPPVLGKFRSPEQGLWKFGVLGCSLVLLSNSNPRTSFCPLEFIPDQSLLCFIYLWFTAALPDMDWRYSSPDLCLWQHQDTKSFLPTALEPLSKLERIGQAKVSSFLNRWKRWAFLTKTVHLTVIPMSPTSHKNDFYGSMTSMVNDCWCTELFPLLLSKRSRFYSIWWSLELVSFLGTFSARHSDSGSVFWYLPLVQGLLEGPSPP